MSNAQYIIFQLLKKKTNKTTDVITGKVMIINFDVSIHSFIYNILQHQDVSVHFDALYKYTNIIVLRWYIRSHLHLTNIIFMNENRHQKQNKKKLK